MSEQVSYSRPQSAANTKKRRSLSLSVVGGLLDILVLLVLALVFSLFVEWIGMTFIWEDQGARHSKDMLAYELDLLDSEFDSDVLGFDRHTTTIDAVNYVNNTVLSAIGVRTLISWIERPVVDVDSEFRLWVRSGYVYVREYVYASINVVSVFTMRVLIALMSMPAFILIGMAAFIDGLTERELRKYGGGNESGFVYHHAKPWLSPLIITAWFFYLGWPESIHPNWIFVPAALMFGGVVYVSTSLFKKYL